MKTQYGIPVRYLAAHRFEQMGALVARCPISGWFVADRRKMMVEGQGTPKKPFQLTSPDQLTVKLFRDRAEAVSALLGS